MKKREPLYILVAIGMIIPAIANAQSGQRTNPKLQDHFYLNSAGLIVGSVEYEPVVRPRPARVSALKNDTTIHLSAGELSDMLTSSQKATITSLRLTGSIDARDFKTMRDSMPALSDVDINAVSISAYTGTQGTAGPQSKTYPANGIPQNAFSLGENIYNAKLNSIILPNSITSIGDSAFYKCINLKGVLTIPNLVISIGNSAFNRCTNLSGTLVLPNSVTTLGEYAFSQCQSLTGLTLSESLASISRCAFDGDWLLQGHLTIPASVTFIDDYAFFYCSFTGVTIPNSVTSIGTGAFGKCKMLSETIIIPSSVTAIRDNTFAVCARLTNIILPNSLTSIGNNAFAMSGLMSITLPDSLISVGNGAFSFSYITGSLGIPASLAYIGHGSFALTGITEFVVDNDNPYFSAVDGILFDKTKTSLIAYLSSRREAYTIPDFTISIGNYAFDYCNGLTDIIIPASVVSIGVGAFDYCFGLTSITANSDIPISLGDSSSVFGENVKLNSTLYVPAGSKTLYQAANQWKDFANIVEMTPTGNGAELSGNDRLILYPNPASKGFYINAQSNEPSAISIYNTCGILVIVSEIKNKDFVDITNLPRGQYIVKVSTPEGTIEKKMLKK